MSKVCSSLLHKSRLANLQMQIIYNCALQVCQITASHSSKKSSQSNTSLLPFISQRKKKPTTKKTLFKMFHLSLRASPDITSTCFSAQLDKWRRQFASRTPSTGGARGARNARLPCIWNLAHPSSPRMKLFRGASVSQIKFSTVAASEDDSTQ